ncbi:MULTISPECIES: hypothetical protein [Bacillus]|nr:MULTISPECIES: hypothetical protein [Bacillus]
MKKVIAQVCVAAALFGFAFAGGVVPQGGGSPIMPTDLLPTQH